MVECEVRSLGGESWLVVLGGDGGDVRVADLRESLESNGHSATSKSCQLFIAGRRVDNNELLPQPSPGDDRLVVHVAPTLTEDVLSGHAQYAPEAEQEPPESPTSFNISSISLSSLVPALDMDNMTPSPSSSGELDVECRKLTNSRSSSFWREKRTVFYTLLVLATTLLLGSASKAATARIAWPKNNTTVAVGASPVRTAPVAVATPAKPTAAWCGSSTTQGKSIHDGPALSSNNQSSAAWTLATAAGFSTWTHGGEARTSDPEPNTDTVAIRQKWHQVLANLTVAPVYDKAKLAAVALLRPAAKGVLKVAVSLVKKLLSQRQCETFVDALERRGLGGLLSDEDRAGGGALAQRLCKLAYKSL